MIWLPCYFRTGNTSWAAICEKIPGASEVTRVAREVGTEGELGGQAGVPGVAGTWKDLTARMIEVLIVFVVVNRNPTARNSIYSNERSHSGMSQASICS